MKSTKHIQTHPQQIPESLESLLQCPQTKKKLVLENSTFKNPSGQIYPSLHSIPWLIPFPHSVLNRWVEKSIELNSYFQNRLLSLDQSLQKNISSMTKKRLNKIKQSLLHNKNTIESCLLPLTSQDKVVKNELTDKIPSHQTLTLYLKNIFRDWSWKTEENSLSLTTIEKILPPNWRPNQFLIIGTGASRLPIELHQKYKLPCSVAVDINPLLLLIAQQMLENQKITLYELPTAPLQLEQVTIENILENPHQKISGFHFIFADVQHLPFKDKSFNSILTPWFIDIVPMSFKQLAQRINRVLAPSGEWLNFGPLGFMFADESECLCFEEIQDTLADQGFKLEKYSIDTIPYLNSPNSTQKRFEDILSFRAIKIKDVAETEFQYLPDWLLNYDLPIPLDPLIKDHQLKAKVNADIIFSIDGNRSVNELSMLMSQHYNITRDSALITIAKYLTKFFESQSRKSFR